MKKYCFLILLAVFVARTTFSQSLGDRILKKAEQRANRKIDRTIDKGLDKAEKEVDESTSGEKKAPSEKTPTKTTTSKESGNNTNPPSAGHSAFSAYKKFDFIPGDRALFIDDFSIENLGDFPSKWNTNGSGEIVAAADNSGKWFELKVSSQYIPTIPKKLPENFTIEFDLMTTGLHKNVSGTANFEILLDDNARFERGRNHAWIQIYLCQYTNIGVKVTSRVNGEEMIKNTIDEEIRAKTMNGSHISIAVNKKRFRLWMDENKVVDIPTLVPPTGIQTVKFGLHGFSNDFANSNVFISNVKIAEGGIDMRSKLITEGRLSTTAITFNVNSDKLKPESMGTIKEIASILEANPTVKIKIVGHTDSDGDDTKNMDLSKKRAAAVKSALIENFAIQADRIQTDGKGESQPSAPNESPEGKAANRRVEFIKL